MRPHSVQQPCRSQITTPTGSIPNAHHALPSVHHGYILLCSKSQQDLNNYQHYNDLTLENMNITNNVARVSDTNMQLE